MITQSMDTHLSAEKFLISLMREARPAKKIAQVRALSRTTIQLSRRAIARAKPHLDEREVNILFVAYHYGNDLAGRLKEYLEKKYRGIH